MDARTISRGSLVFALAALTVTAHAQATLYTFDGDSTADFFGFSTSGAGDVNGDGVPDFIVGAPFDDNHGENSGSARVYSGQDGAVLYTFNGDSNDDLFGVSVSCAGDVDGDGYDDLIVGARGDDNNGSNSGSARVFSGFDGSILYTFNGDAPFDSFGSSVRGAGDVDGDGFADVIVGAHLADNNGASSGSAQVFSGCDGSVLHVIAGDSAGAQFGLSVSGAGDVNGDGYSDFIVGAARASNVSGDPGSARVFSGVDGTILYTFFGDSGGDRFGWSVSGAGDIDGDGYHDLIVGAILDDDNGDKSGSARVFSGFDGSVIYTFRGDSAGDIFGASVSEAGDVDGDGFDDMIVGAYEHPTGPGKAQVFSGFDGSIIHTFRGDSVGDLFGRSVSGLGDLDGDGFADVIVGAQGDDNNGLSSGSVRVISGRPSPRGQLEQLLGEVVFLNLNLGIENSLDAKLDAIFLALNDMVDGNDAAVIVLLESFIAQVQAQSGNQIPVEDADALIASAQRIILLLNEP